MMLCNSITIDSSDGMKTFKSSPTHPVLPMTPVTSTAQSPLELRSKHDGLDEDEYSEHSRFEKVLFSDPPSSPPMNPDLSPTSEMRDANINPVQEYFLTSMQGQVDLAIRLLLSACASLRDQHISVDARLEERYKKEDGPRYRRCAPHNHDGRGNSTLVMFMDPAESEILDRVKSLLDMTKKSEKERLRYARENGIKASSCRSNWENEMNEVLVEVAGGIHWWCRETH